MPTSGVTGSLTYSLADLLEQAVLKTGWTQDMLTGNQMRTAITETNLFLSSLINRGINLWKINRVMIGLRNGQVEYDTPSGTIDILNLNFRTLQTLSGSGTAYSSAGGDAANAFDQDTDTACVQTSADGYISYTVSSPVQVGTFGFLPDETSTLDLVLEYSNDGGVTWSVSYAFGEMEFTDNLWFYMDLPRAYQGDSWRVRETGGGTLKAREVVFSYGFTEIPVWRFNRDDYSNQPNKYFQGQPLNFYYERSRDIPKVITWPVSPSDFTLFSGFLTRHLEDVLDPEDTIDVPQRWVDYIMFALANRLLLNNIGDVNRQPMIKAEMVDCLLTAESEERDSATSTWTPNVSAYTRG